MESTVHDIIGITGLVLESAAFFLLQQEKISPKSWSYLGFIFVGTAMMLYSLYYTWNLTAVIANYIWNFIAFYNIIKYRILNRK